MKNIETSRRDFLKLTGRGLFGAAAVAAVPAAAAMAEGDPSAPAYPWTWRELDKEEVLKYGYEGYFNKGGCCAGVVNGIIGLLAEKYGYPYNQIMPQVFANGGGGYGVGTLCGALGGACAVIGMFCEAKDSRAVRDQLFAWYKDQPFPGYQPERESITTVAHSLTCADSLGTYLAATGEERGSKAHTCRCGGLTADVAAKTVELLNIHFGLEAAPVVEEAPAAELADNEYIGEGQGFGGTVKVKVTMDGDKIAKIEVLENSDTIGISDAAYNTIPQAIIDAQSTNVDVATGATFSSKGIMAAVEDALSKVKK